MKNLIQTSLLAIATASLGACAVQTEEPAVETREQDLALLQLDAANLAVGSPTTSAKVSSGARIVAPSKLEVGKGGSGAERLAEISGADLKLAAMAHHVAACRGAVSGADFVSRGEFITPGFVELDLSRGFVGLPNGAIVHFPKPGKVRAIRGDVQEGAKLACPAAEDALGALANVVNLAGGQKTDPEVGVSWARSWQQAEPVKDCPAWIHVGTASGDPSVLSNLLKGNGKTTEYFKIDGEVERALACAAGYGDAFIVGIEGSLIETDPAYWEDPRNWGYGNSPYYKAQPYGYVHNMASYNDSFAAIQRIGEKCVDPLLAGVLIENDCSDDPAYPWYCNSICK